MCFLQVQPTNIHLKGISRVATFTIRNKNQFLAVSYSLNFSKGEPEDHSKLSVFPSRGVLLHDEEQRVKIKYIAGNNESTLDEFSAVLSVKFTYKIEYNRHYMQKYNLSGWEELADTASQRHVEVTVGGEREAIQHYIKEDIIFKQEFGKDQLNLSKIQQSKSNSFIHEQSYNDLEIDSKIQQNLSTALNKIGKQNVPEKLSSLPFQEIIPLQYGQSRITPKKRLSKFSQSMFPKEPLVESRLITDQPQQNRSYVLQMKTVCNNEFSNDLSETQIQPENRSFELLILAIISAFFLALGNNIGRIVS